jgi:hypothetical protein
MHQFSLTQQAVSSKDFLKTPVTEVHSLATAFDTFDEVEIAEQYTLREHILITKMRPRELVTASCNGIGCPNVIKFIQNSNGFSYLLLRELRRVP